MNNISVKLKHTAVQALVAFLHERFDQQQFSTRKDAIVYVLMLKFYLKLAQKTIVMQPREYTITVEVETALAFLEYFTKTEVNPISHAGNTISTMMAEYDSFTTNLIA